MTAPTKAWIELEKRYIEEIMGGMPQCHFCIHEIEHGKCKAFPGGIPLKIISGEHDHKEAYPGDGGIRFEPREDAEDYGGEGSGHWGHRGIPGEQGGSTASGGIVSLAGELRSEAEAAEPELTRIVQGAVEENRGEMEGLDFRLKSEDSLKSKIRREMEESGGVLTPEEAAKRVTDSVRYTAVFESDDLVAGAKSVQGTLAERGWTRYDTKFRNYYGPGDAYDGYNCVFVNQKTGLRFELQFHTPQSLAIKGKVHKLYERARELGPGPERTQLFEQMTVMWESPDYVRPRGWETLPGVRMDLQ